MLAATNEQLDGSMPPEAPADVLRPLRRRAAVAWASWVLSLGLLWGEHQLRVLHPLSVPFLLLLVVTFGSALGALARGLSRALRGPRRAAALAWAGTGVLPALLWPALGWYGFRQWGRREVPHDLPFTLVKMAGATLMEAQARYLYPHRLETDRLVMFYGGGVADPQGDAEAMDRHIARLEEMTGLPHRAKVWWVRGPLLGQRHLALYGLALGSPTSPASALDRHELAHAVFYQHAYPDSDPPTLLLEGWAESQSADSRTLADRALSQRQFFAERGLGWGKMSGPEREEFLRTLVDPEGCQRLFAKGGVGSYLRELTGPFWYHHDAGPVYGVGGAFVDFLLRRHGPRRFVELCFACRPGRFEAECRGIYGTDLDALEKQFWEDAERLAREARPPGPAKK